MRIVINNLWTKFTRRVVFGGIGVILVMVILAASAPTVVSLISSIPEHLQLETSKDRIINVQDFANGDIQYGYRSDVRITTTPSANVYREAGKSGVAVTGEIVSKRTDHSRTFQTNKSNRLVTEIISGVPQYYKDDSGTWWQAEYATTTREAFDEQMELSMIEKFFGANYDAFAATTSTSTIYSETDGLIDGDTAYATCTDLYTARTSDATSKTTTGDNLTVSVNSAACSTDEWTVTRAFMVFNAENAIGDDETIISANLDIWDETVEDAFSASLVPIITDPAASTTLALADHFRNSKVAGNGDVIGTALDLTSISALAHYDWDLNATGTAAISKTGTTSLGFAIDFDQASTTPSWSATVSGVAIAASERNGSSKDPKLTVVHEPFAETFAAYKSVDQDDSNNTDVFNNADDELKLGFETDKTYLISGILFVTNGGAAQPDLKIGFSIPSGADMDIGYFAETSGIVGEVLETPLTATAGESSKIDMSSGEVIPVQIMGSVKTSSTKGLFRLHWAQNSSNATETTIKKGSYLRAEELP